MKRPQFTLRSLLVAMLVVAAFFGGADWSNRRRSTKEAVLLSNLELLDKALAETFNDNIKLQKVLAEHDIDLPAGVRPLR